MIYINLLVMILRCLILQMRTVVFSGNLGRLKSSMTGEMFVFTKEISVACWEGLDLRWSKMGTGVRKWVHIRYIILTTCYSTSQTHSKSLRRFSL